MHPRVAKARLSLALDRRYRFYASLLESRLTIVEDPTCKTFWVDGISLGYNPAYVETIDDEEIKGVLAHEAMHPALGHNFRVAGRDPAVANEAGDYAINPYIVASGLKLPKGALLDSKYDGSLEENYAKIMREREQQRAQSQQQRQSASQQPKTGSDKAAGLGQGKDQGQPDQSGQQQGQPDQGQGTAQSGGAQSAKGHGDTQQIDFDPGCGEVRPYPGDNPGEAEAKWKVAVLQAAKVAQMVGEAPGWLQGVLEGYADPSVDWRSLLQRFAQDVSATDYTYARPNKRYLHLGLYLPSLHEPAVEDAVFVRDSSGSVWSEIQAQFDAEIVNVFETMRPARLVVLDCDTRVTQVQIFERGDTVDLKPVCGGGGTSFVAPFIRVGEEGINPAFLVYLTDMEGAFPQEDPGYPVLWASTTPLKKARSAPFGETIEVVI
jgi:predicted metal-dependent peptidase